MRYERTNNKSRNGIVRTGTIPVAAIATLSLFVGPQASLAGDSEWISLFNGRNLSGWDGDSRLWAVKDGIIHGETTLTNPARGVPKYHSRTSDEIVIIERRMGENRLHRP